MEKWRPDVVSVLSQGSASLFALLDNILLIVHVLQDLGDTLHFVCLLLQVNQEAPAALGPY